MNSFLCIVLKLSPKEVILAQRSCKYIWYLMVGFIFACFRKERVLFENRIKKQTEWVLGHSVAACPSFLAWSCVAGLILTDSLWQKETSCCLLRVLLKPWHFFLPECSLGLWYFNSAWVVVMLDLLGMLSGVWLPNNSLKYQMITFGLKFF